MSSQKQKVCALLFTVFISYSMCGATHVDIECFPNDTITTTNPLPESLFYAVAINEAGECNVTFSQDNSLISISGCAKNSSILLQLSEIAHQNTTIVGGSGTVMLTLLCQEITEGLERNFTHSMRTYLAINEVVSQDVTFQPSLYIRKTPTSDALTIATIMEAVYITYDLHKNYTMTFDLCTAYSGETVSASSAQHLLITDGCTEDAELIDSFVPGNTVAVGDDVRYYTGMRMFRFFVSTHLTVACNVHICRVGGGANCNMNMCATRRRRRSPEINEVADSDDEHTTVWRTLQVVDNPDIQFLENTANIDVMLPRILLYTTVVELLFVALLQ